MANAYIYKQVMDILNNRRKQAKLTREEHIREVEKVIPNIAVLRKRLTQTSIQLVKVVSSQSENVEQSINQIQKANIATQKEIQQLLESNGYPKDYLKLHFVCEKCKDTGFIGQKQCNCFTNLLKETAAKKMLGAIDISQYRFDNFSLDYYDSEPFGPHRIIPRKIMTRVFNYCKNYAQNFGANSTSLFLKGNTGLGKTHLSLAIACKVMDQGFDVIYGTTSDLLRQISSQMFDRTQNHSETLAALLNCDLLILDDLGAEFDSNFNITIIYDIINTRYNKKAPTIINTNLTSKELERKYSPRILSRLYTYQSLNCVGTDVRQIKATKK